MRWFLKKSALVLFGLFILIVLPGLARDRQARQMQVDRSPGDWDTVHETANEIDQLINQFAQETGCTPLPAAEELKVARRLTLALLGTIPSLEEIRAFQSLPPDHRLEVWTDRLLQDPRCHDYLAERFARAMVSSLPVEPFFIYRRRRFVSWLSDQFAANRPYDSLVREVISSEGVWTEQPAANFVTAHQMDPERLANRTARAFLGLRLDCAECHNHPFADWTQEDFRGLAAYFGQCDFGLRGVEDKEDKQFVVEVPGSNQERVVDPRFPFLADFEASDGRLREQLAAWVTDEQNPYFAAAISNRMWRLMFGRGLIEPVDDLEGDETVPGVIDLLAEDLRQHHFDLRRLIRVITATDAFRRQSAIDTDVDLAAEEQFAAFPLTRLRPEQVAASLVQVSSLHSMDYERNLLVRIAAWGNRNDFIELYGDAGEDELAVRQGNIPQRLLMMNGKTVRERIASGLLSTAGRLSSLAPTDDKCIEIAYLVCLCRPPSAEEAEYFRSTMAEKSGEQRQKAVEDLLWALINCTEFSWND